MEKNRKICIATCARSDYGLLYWVMKELQAEPTLDLQIIVTGMHLSPEFGLTFKTIEQDGFKIDEKVEMLISGDSPVSIAKSMGLGTIGFADALNRLNPDLLVILGDRFEFLSAAQAALVATIPIAHIAGGDTTEGAYDEAIRHSITKMSHLHFVTNADSEKRVKQLGENPDFIFNYGSPGLDYINRGELFNRAELEKEIEFSFKKRNLLTTFHPVTLGTEESDVQLNNLLIALDELGEEYGQIFTLPNADNYGRKLITILEDYTGKRDHTKLYASLGQKKYLSTIAQVDVVIGNSSSGLYEVPSFKKPTVNIGDRQKGRLKAASVIDCNSSTENILNAITKAFNSDYSKVVNPYGDGNSSKRIVSTIKGIKDFNSLLQKKFFWVNE